MKNRGITLIALVITIIILLILAGVTIGQLTENGLFEKIKLAEEKYTNEEKLENETLKNYNNQIKQYIYGTRDELTGKEIGISGYTHIFRASLNNTEISEKQLSDFTRTTFNNFDEYLKYENGYLTCIKDGWYELQMTAKAYSSSGTGSYVITYLIINDYSQTFTNSVSVNLNSRGYSDINSKTLYLKQGDKINIKKSIETYNFSTECSCIFDINKL